MSPAQIYNFLFDMVRNKANTRDPAHFMVTGPRLFAASDGHIYEIVLREWKDDEAV